jgi:uncharacterized damage-inducible protein DinB
MEIIPMLLKEMDQEAETTRKMLSRVPADKFDWQPHEKSMKMMNLATHIAELPDWVSMAIKTDELDFAKNEYKPTIVSSTAELVDVFEKSLAGGRADLAATNEKILAEPWTLRMGEQVLMTSTKEETIRHTYCQMVHHRAQLGVYLRLLDIPIPGSYGPSADEQ